MREVIHSAPRSAHRGSRGLERLAAGLERRGAAASASGRRGDPPPVGARRGRSMAEPNTYRIPKICPIIAQR